MGGVRVEKARQSDIDKRKEKGEGDAQDAPVGRGARFCVKHQGDGGVREEFATEKGDRVLCGAVARKGGRPFGGI